MTTDFQSVEFSRRTQMTVLVAVTILCAWPIPGILFGPAAPVTAGGLLPDATFAAACRTLQTIESCALVIVLAAVGLLLLIRKNFSDTAPLNEGWVFLLAFAVSYSFVLRMDGNGGSTAQQNVPMLYALSQTAMILSMTIGLASFKKLQTMSVRSALLAQFAGAVVIALVLHGFFSSLPSWSSSTDYNAPLRYVFRTNIILVLGLGLGVLPRLSENRTDVLPIIPWLIWISMSVSLILLALPGVSLAGPGGLWAGGLRVLSGILILGGTLLTAVLQVHSQDLQREKEKLRKILDALPYMIFATNSKKQVIHINRQGAEFLDVEPSEAVGRRARAISNILDTNGPEDIILGASESGPRSLHVTQYPIGPDDNGGIHTVGFGSDVTEQRLAEAKSAEEELRFRQLAELLPEVIFEIDGAGTITFASAYALDLFGYTEEDLSGNFHSLDLLAPEERDGAGENMRRTVEQPKRRSTEYTAVRKDGTRFPVLIRTTPIEAGNPAGGIRGILFDISEQKQMEATIQRHLQAEKLVASISRSFLDPMMVDDTPGIADILYRVGRIVGANRVNICRLSEDGNELSVTHEWCTTGARSRSMLSQSAPIATFPWAMGELGAFDSLFVPDVANMPPEAEFEQKRWKKMGIGAIHIVPMLRDGKLEGFLSSEYDASISPEAEHHGAMLRSIGEVLVMAWPQRAALSPQ